MSESKRPRGKYKTTNWADYNKALKARGSLTVWLDKGMQWYATATGKRGRQPTFSNAAIQFCLSIKCLFGLALRQSLGLVESLLRLAGLDWKVPDFSTVCRRQKSLSVTLPYRPSTTALDLLVDSTGIKFPGEGEWKCKKHGAEYRCQWRKVHLCIDASTLEIRAIEVTDNGVGDAPMLPELLSQIPADEPIGSVSGDGAYDTKACHAAIAQRQAHAIIPPRKNVQIWKTRHAGGEMRNEAVRACQRLGRSLVETKMHIHGPPKESKLWRRESLKGLQPYIRVLFAVGAATTAEPGRLVAMARAQGLVTDSCPSGSVFSFSLICSSCCMRWRNFSTFSCTRSVLAGSPADCVRSAVSSTSR